MKSLYVIAISALALFDASPLHAAEPIKLSASDMVCKAYGVLGCNMSKEQASQALKSQLNLSPEEDNGMLWVDADSGYAISYHEMTPEVSAAASFCGNRIADYVYFFEFPCVDGIDSCEDPDHCTCGKCHLTRSSANKLQAAFGGTLLQEMEDIGMDMGVKPFTDAVYEAEGTYGDNHVNVRLISDTSGYILILDVHPTPLSDLPKDATAYLLLPR